jgi:hypothetical protein
MALKEALTQLENKMEELEESVLLFQKRRRTETAQLKNAVKIAREKLIRAVSLISSGENAGDKKQKTEEKAFFNQPPLDNEEEK